MAEAAFFVMGFDDTAATEATELIFGERLIALRFFSARHYAQVRIDGAEWLKAA